VSLRTELEASLREIVGKGLRQDAYYPVVAPKTAGELSQVVRAAREHKFNLLVLGNESSKPPQHSTLRENILVVLNVWLTGIEKLSPFSVRVLSGTPISSVVNGGSAPPRKTLGGLICGASGSHRDVTLRTLWSHVRCLEVITASGELQRFSAPMVASAEDPATANLFLGSRGRLGIVASVELIKPIPIPVLGVSESNTQGTTERNESLISHEDVQVLLDPDGLFRW